MAVSTRSRAKAKSSVNSPAKKKSAAKKSTKAATLAEPKLKPQSPLKNVLSAPARRGRPPKAAAAAKVVPSVVGEVVVGEAVEEVVGAKTRGTKTAAKSVPVAQEAGSELPDQSAHKATRGTKAAAKSAPAVQVVVTAGTATRGIKTTVGAKQPAATRSAGRVTKASAARAVSKPISAVAAGRTTRAGKAPAKAKAAPNTVSVCGLKCNCEMLIMVQKSPVPEVVDGQVEPDTMDIDPVEEPAAAGQDSAGAPALGSEMDTHLIETEIEVASEPVTEKDFEPEAQGEEGQPLHEHTNAETEQPIEQPVDEPVEEAMEESSEETTTAQISPAHIKIATASSKANKKKKRVSLIPVLSPAASPVAAAVTEQMKTPEPEKTTASP
ncbi:hypothetical protein LTS18_008744, partial [Coniosporium uncinatum]